MSKIDIDKFVASWIKRCSSIGYAGEGLTPWYDSILAEQGLTYKDGEIVSIEFDVPETDYEKKNKDAIRAIKQALRQLATNGVPVGNMIEAIKDIEEKESEDEKIRKNIIATIHLYYGEPLDDEAKEMIAWLEKQGKHANFLNKIQIGDKVTRNRDGMLVNLSQLNRVAKKDEKQGEQKPKRMVSAEAKEAMYNKPAWSEEDESLRLRTIGALETCKIGSPTKCVDEQINWLKSLRPQNRWKPSDEQMEALWSATEKYLESDNENVRKLRGEVLESLYEDLKKLREE